MSEFERRGLGPQRGLFLHGYEAKVTDGGTCDRCSRKLADAYLVSHDGERATHRICPACHSFLRAAYGIEPQAEQA